MLLQSFFYIDEFSGVVVREFSLATYRQLFTLSNFDIIRRTADVLQDQAQCTAQSRVRPRALTDAVEGRVGLKLPRERPVSMHRSRMRTRAELRPIFASFM